MSQAVTADQERTVNWYTERSESAEGKPALYPTPGVTALLTVTGAKALADIGSGRGHAFIDGREFAVIANKFYEIARTGALTLRGTVAADGNPATISSNGDGGGQLFITSGGNGYVFDLGTAVLTTVANLSGKATMGAHLDGYFLALDADESKLYISDLLDGLTWNPTQFAQRSIAPDPWRSMKVLNRQIWLFGEETSEVWYNTGASPFPFAPNPSGFLSYGISAPFSPAVADGSIMWLGKSAIGNVGVYRAAGFTPDVVSNYPMQAAVDQYHNVADAQGDSYNDLGHTFYLLTFPQEDVTWAWDAQTNQWAERGTWLSEENRFTAWRPRWHAYAFAEHRWLDGNTAALYRSSLDSPLDVEDRAIRRMRRAPGLTAENQMVFYTSFELDLEPGLGKATGQGENPHVMMRQSRDGGKTWGTEQMRPAGKIGEYFRRVRWNRCGSARRMVFEVSVTDPIPWKLTGAYLSLAQPIQGVGQQAAVT